jgi:hypothetical protein
VAQDIEVDPEVECPVERPVLDGFMPLTPVERFDQLVRTVRFIEAGRRAVRRQVRG